MRKDIFVLGENLTTRCGLIAMFRRPGRETDSLRWWLNCFRGMNDRFYCHDWHLIASTSRYHHRAWNTRRVYASFGLLSLITNEIYAYTQTTMRERCILYDGRSFILRCNYVPVVFNAPLGIFLSECARFRLERDLFVTHDVKQAKYMCMYICIRIGRARRIKGQDTIKIPDNRRFTVSSSIIIILIQPSVYEKNRASLVKNVYSLCDTKICRTRREIIRRYAKEYLWCNTLSKSPQYFCEMSHRGPSSLKNVLAVQ